MTTTKARQTGTHVTLEAGNARFGGRYWMLICDEHAEYCDFKTKRQAIHFRSSPIDWCEECRDNWRNTNNA